MAKTIRIDIIADSKRFLAELNKSQAGMVKFQKTSKIAGVALAGGLGLALVKSVNLAADFEQSMNTLEAVSGATADQMAQVSQKAKDLGRDFSLPGTSAKDAADAMTELAKGGLDVEEAMDAAKGVLQLSAAAQIENAEAATITARALNSFGLEGKDAIKVADLLAATANASTAEITDVAAAMQQSAANAEALGIPIEDLTTAIGLMADAGITGSDAGTSLKTMFARLIPQTDKAKGAMQRLNVDAFDSEGKFKGLRNVIGQYRDALQKLNPEQRQAAIRTIFGSDAQRAANIILGRGVDKWDKMRDATTKGGEAARIAQAKTSGLKGSMDKLKSSLETLGITLGEALLPALTDIFDKMATFAGWLEKHKTLTQILVVEIGLLAAALIVAGIATSLLAAPFVAAGAALAGLTAAVVIAYQRSETFRRVVQALAGVLMTVIGILPTLALLASRHFGTIKAVGVGAFNAVLGAINGVIGAIKDAIGWLQSLKSWLDRITPNFGSGAPGFKSGPTDRGGNPRLGRAGVGRAGSTVNVYGSVVTMDDIARGVTRRGNLAAFREGFV